MKERKSSEDMMSSTLHKDLQSYYQQFHQDHDRLRSELLSSLSSLPVETRKTLVFPWRRAALALAASFLVVLGLWFLNNNPAPSAVDPQAAWASTVQRASQVQSMHLMASTAGAANKTSSVEIWWRRPGCVKMLWSNGNINTSNMEMNYRLDQKNNTLTMVSSQTLAPEMMILDWFVEMFTSEKMVSQSWVGDFRKVQDSQPVDYQGLKCQLFSFEREKQRFDYIVDPQTSRILQAKMYNKNNPDKLLYNMEVLAIDEDYSDAFFTIQPQPGQKVINRAGLDKNKNISPLPMLGK